MRLSITFLVLLLAAVCAAAQTDGMRNSDERSATLRGGGLCEDHDIVSTCDECITNPPGMVQNSFECETTGIKWQCIPTTLICQDCRIGVAADCGGMMLMWIDPNCPGDADFIVDQCSRTYNPSPTSGLANGTCPGNCVLPSDPG